MHDQTLCDGDDRTPRFYVSVQALVAEIGFLLKSQHLRLFSPMLLSNTVNRCLFSLLLISGL